MRPAGRLLYDGECPFCVRSAGWLGRIAGGRVACEASEPGRGAGAVEWIGADGERLLGADAVVRVWREAGGAWGLAARVARVWPAMHVARRVYRLVARGRWIWSRACGVGRGRCG